MNKQTQLRIAQKLQAATQRGVSNIQVAIVILVGILLLLGGLSGYRYIQQAKTNNEIQTLTDLKAQVIRLGEFSPITLNATTGANQLGALGFFSNSTIKVRTDGSAENTWGGDVTAIAPTTSSIEFTYVGVPSAVCGDIATKLNAVADSINVAGVEVKAAGADADIAAVATNCAGGAKTMKFVMTK